jgi:hypothetical protein
MDVQAVIILGMNLTSFGRSGGALSPLDVLKSGGGEGSEIICSGDQGAAALTKV